MSSNPQVWMLATIYLAQIFVLSFISPARFIAAYRKMFERYPPEQFARLYPVPIEQMRQWQRVRMMLHSSIGCAGFVVLVTTLLTAERLRQFALVMLAFSMIQLLPTLVMVAQHRRLIKEVAKMAPPAKRSAPLHVWRLTDFVSPRSIALGFITTAAALGTAAYLYFVDSRLVPMLGYCAIVCVFCLLRMLQLVFLPLKITRPDPFMAPQDVLRRRQMQLRAPFGLATFFGIFCTFMMLYVARAFSIDFAYIAAGISVMMQVFSLRVTAKLIRTLESTDFSVYRELSALSSLDRPSVA